MDAEKNEDLLGSAPMNRRSMLKRVLLGGAVAYAAPVVATFALDGAAAQGGSPDRIEFPIGGNQDWGFPRGGNQDRGSFEGFDFGDVPPGEGAPATPEPTPEPTVAPTTVAKKPKASKPKSGGNATPNFTG
jgi:hypothetical protein